MQKLAVILAACATACAHTQYTDSVDSALGRVVVYRNGIAYYERRAAVAEDRLTLRVPAEKVDDFLRSLTVVDEETGDALPISFPTQSAAENGLVNMEIQLPPANGRIHNLRLSYITESPAWKPSYRLVVGDDGTVEVQSWAIVDNASGEDWNDVRLAVGASSALSFRFDLRSIRAVHRETLALDESFARPPPVGMASTTEHRSTATGALARFEEEALPEEPATGDDLLADLAAAQARPAGEADANGGGGSGHRRRPPAPPASAPMRSSAGATARPRASELDALASSLRQSGQRVTIRGYGAASDRDPGRGALERANRLRNHLIEQGVAPAQLDVAAADEPADAGPGGVEVVADARAQTEASGDATVSEGPGIGESHFESASTMTVPHETSAMISVLREHARGEIVYFYDPDSERGDARFAYRSVRFQNPTAFTLEAGPATVYGSGRFIGEGLTEAIPPGAHAFIPFSLDRQVRVEREPAQRDEIARILAVDHGVMTAEFRHVRATTLRVRNRSRAEATVFVRHPVPAGWSLRNPPEQGERVGDDYVFRVALAAGESKELTLEQDTPMERTVDLRSTLARQMLRVYLARTDVPAAIAEPLRAVLALHGEIEAKQAETASREQQIADLRTRVDELHAQILTLEAVGRRDNPLLRQLRARMAEISDRIQASTMQIVDLQQELLMLRIRFQDGLAELELRGAPVVASAEGAAS